MTAKELGILLNITANSAEAQAALQGLAKQINTLPGEAKKGASGMSAAFNSFRQDFNRAFTFSLGQMMANGLQSGVSAVKQFSAESMAEFRKFEDAMTGVEKTTGIPKAAATGLADALRQSAVDLKGLGESAATQMAEIAEVAGQLGIAQDKIAAGKFKDAADELASFSEVIAKAKIALPEFTGGAEQIATVISKQLLLYKDQTAAYGSAGEAANAYLATMNELSNTTAANAAQIAAFLEGFTMAPQLKMTQEQVQGLGATFVSLGQDASDASTRFQSAISNLLKDTKDSQAAFETLGMTSAEFKTRLGTDATGAILQIVDALGKVQDPAQKVQLSMDLFGQVGARAMNSLIGNTDLVRQNIDIASQAISKATSLTDEFATATSKLTTPLDAMHTQVEDIQITIGQNLTQAISQVAATDISPTIGQFRTWLTTSQEAATFFQITLPAAISGVTAALSGIAQGGVAAFNWIAQAGTDIGTLIGDLQTGQTSVGELAAAIGGMAASALADVTGLTPTIDALREAWPKITAEINSLKTAVVNGFQAISAGIDAGAAAVKRFGEAVKNGVFQNEKIISSFQKLTDKIMGVDDALEGHSLTPALENYTAAATTAAAGTDDLAESLTEQTTSIVAAESGWDNLSNLFGSLGTDSSSLVNEISSLISSGDGLRGVFDSLTSSGGGLNNMLLNMAGPAGPFIQLGQQLLDLASNALGLNSTLTQLGGIIPGLIGKLFGEAKSEGKQAAEAMQEFVSANVAGGDQLAAAMAANYSAMSAAGNDFATFLQQTGTTMDQTFGGISANWQQGSTALDLFTQSLVAAGIPMEKAPQQALQMMASFQDMGLSAEEAGAKMLEIAKASGMSEAQVKALQDALANVKGELTSTGEEGEATTTVFDDATQQSEALTSQVDGLAESLDTVKDKLDGAGSETQTTSGLFDTAGVKAQDFEAQIGGLAEQSTEAGDSLQTVQDALDKLPPEKLVKLILDIQAKGAIPTAKAFGGPVHGLALVGDRFGPEIAALPGGRNLFVGLHGPEVRAFPAGTEIIPNQQIDAFLRSHPVAAYAAGGTIPAAPESAARPGVTQTIHVHLPTSARVLGRAEFEQFVKDLRVEFERQARLQIKGNY